ncbi:hypothetical protein WICPIJ_007768 [Wickerhamomyces pijperi]|uniref:DM2 domain-containing protein n=1 Tax=Wickerhamomyces pijperi TaxID=599730 RepID=A0A9P8PZL2_WICPI|nr:hypothetical protein WICPIJ_007768 [Wickerhamomyces pijperi]
MSRLRPTAAAQQRPVAATANAAPPPQPIPQAVLQTRPTNTNIPDSIASLVPEVELYRRLQEAERRIDLLTARKINDFQENLAKLPYQKQLLRVFVYNTASNQPWQVKDLPGNHGEPEWTLRIEGRLVNEEKSTDEKRRKFSSLLSGISVDILPNLTSIDPNTQPGQTVRDNIVEWSDSTDPNANRVEFDGMDIKRAGFENMKARVTIQPKDLPTRFQTSTALASLLGVSEITQHDAVYSIWLYVQENNLQASENKKLVICDSVLARLFGVPRFDFKQIISLLTPHLSPIKPIVIEYEIRVDRETTLGDVVVDIEVSMEDLTTQELIRNESRNLVNELDINIKETQNKLHLGLQGLHNAYKKYEFYDAFSQDPVRFLQNFNESNAKLLKILAGDDHYNEEDVRRADYYTDDMLAENIDVLLKTGRV